MNFSKIIDKLYNLQRMTQSVSHTHAAYKFTLELQILDSDY